MILYKYMKLEHLKDALDYGVYASKIDCFNDPYEWDDIRYGDDYRICCLTKAHSQMLMWAYYTNHRGCRVSFEVEDADFKPVYYVKQKIDRRKMNKKEARDSLYTKGNNWKLEKEYRAIYDEKGKNPKRWIKSKDKDKVFYRAPVVEVRLGTESYRSDLYERVLEYLAQYNKKHNNQIKVSSCLLSHDKYAVEEDRQFDFLRELEKSKTQANTFIFKLEE